MAEQSRHKDSKKKKRISACGEKMSLIMMEKEIWFKSASGEMKQVDKKERQQKYIYLQSWQ